jgi:hypothetical protein
MRKKEPGRFRKFHFDTCPFCGSDFRPEDIIYSLLNELGLFGVLIECRQCRIIYCVQRATVKT